MLYVEVPEGEDPVVLARRVDAAIGRIGADYDQKTGYIRIFASHANQSIEIPGKRKEVREAVAELGLALLS